MTFIINIFKKQKSKSLLIITLIKRSKDLKKRIAGFRVTNFVLLQVFNL